MSLSSKVVDSLIEMVRRDIDKRQGLRPIKQAVSPTVAATALSEELRRCLDDLDHKVRYFAPPEHVDATAARIAALSLEIAGLVGRIGRNVGSQDGATG